MVSLFDGAIDIFPVPNFLRIVSAARLNSVTFNFINLESLFHCRYASFFGLSRHCVYLADTGKAENLHSRRGGGD